MQGKVSTTSQSRLGLGGVRGLRGLSVVRFDCGLALLLATISPR